MFTEGQTVARRETGEKVLIDGVMESDKGAVYHGWYLGKEGHEGQFFEAELEPVNHKALEKRLPATVNLARSWARMFAEANAGANWIAASVEPIGDGRLNLLLTAAHQDANGMFYNKAVAHRMRDYWRAEMLELAAIINIDLRRYSLELWPAASLEVH